MKYGYCLLFISWLFCTCKSRLYKVSSSSMEGTIKAGENFLVTESDKFERNDIVVFDYYGPDYSSLPEEPGNFKLHWEKWVFRLVACSGDEIEIKNDEVFINGRHIPPPPLSKLYYEIKSSVYIDDILEEKDPYDITTEKRGDTMIYTLSLTPDEVKKYRQRKPAIISVEKRSAGYRPDDTLYAKLSLHDKWSSADYGPLKIPSPGDTIEVTAGNYKLYKNIPEIKMGKNVIKEKLYFVLGDNRYSAQDSRFIGFISHSNMQGIVHSKN